jgi:tetratricopeptide (TPR) repeat protein
VGKIPHVSSNVQHIGPLSPLAALRVFSSQCPRKISANEILEDATYSSEVQREEEKATADTNAEDEVKKNDSRKIEHLLANRPDLLQQHKFVVTLKGNPGAISLVTSLLEDMSFHHVRSLVGAYLTAKNTADFDTTDTMFSDYPDLEETLAEIREFVHGVGGKRSRLKGFSSYTNSTDEERTSQAVTQQGSHQIMETSSIYRRSTNRVDSKLEEADTLRSLAIVKFHMGDNHLSQSLLHLEDALKIYESKHDDIGFAAASQLRAEIQMLNESVSDTCMLDLERALRIYRDKQDVIGEAWTLKMLAELHLLLVQERSGLNKWDNSSHSIQTASIGNAKSTIEQSMTIFLELKNQNGEAAALRVRGRVNLALGNRVAATDDLNKALAIFKVSGNVLGTAGTLRLLGIVKAQNVDYERGKAHLKAALEKYRSVKHRCGEMACLRQLGNLHFTTRHSADAVRCLRKALSIAETRHVSTRVQRQDKAFILRSLGEVLVESGDPEVGLAHLEAAVPLFRELNREAALVDTMRLVEDQHNKDTTTAATPQACGGCVIL